MANLQNLDDIEKHLEAKYEGSPRWKHGVMTALADIRSAMSTLANMGHHFELRWTDAPPPTEWPKMFYHPDGRTLTIHSPEVAEQLSPEWGTRQGGAKPEDEPRVKEASPPEPIMLGVGSDGSPAVVGPDGENTPVGAEPVPAGPNPTDAESHHSEPEVQSVDTSPSHPMENNRPSFDP